MSGCVFMHSIACIWHVCMFAILVVVPMPPTTPRRGRCGRGRGSGRGLGEAALEAAPMNVDMAAVLAEMLAIHAEINALRQAPGLGDAASALAPVASSCVPTGGG
jgi:hypothetical protein